MAKRSGKNHKTQAKLKEFVVVASASDLEQARDYETLLKSNEIPATIREHLDEATQTKGFEVLVPEDALDEAHVVIESHDVYDDFYDFTLEDEDDDDDFSDGFFENDF